MFISVICQVTRIFFSNRNTNFPTHFFLLTWLTCVAFWPTTLFADPAESEVIIYIHPDGTGGYPTIQAGLDAAPAGALIYLMDGYYFEHDLRPSSPVRIRSYSIEPGHVTIDAQGHSTVFNCDNLGTGFLDLYQLTLKGASVAAMSCHEFSAEVSSCIFELNTGNGYQGNMSGTTFSDCTFYGNGGAGITGDYFNGTASSCEFNDNQVGISCTFSSPTIDNCFFFNNSPFGGARFYEGEPHLIGCEFRNNHSQSDGGGLNIGGINGAQITDSTFETNESDGNGGGVFCGDGGTFINCDFFSNQSLGNGGGVRCSYGEFNTNIFEDCRFSYNIGNQGAGVSELNSYSEFTRCTFGSNTGDGYRGNVSIDWPLDSTTFQNCNFEYNSGRGASLIGISEASFEECEFIANAGGLAIENTAYRALVTQCNFLFNQAIDGGAIYSVNSTLVVDYSGLINNVADTGGGIFCQSGGSLSIENSTLADNIALIYGGGIYAYNLSGNFYMEDTIIAFNQGEAFHGPYAVGPDRMFIRCSDVYGNSGGDWNWGIEDFFEINDNLNVDPRFYNREQFDYHLLPVSPCRAGNPPCGPIGQLGVKPVAVLNLPNGDGSPLTMAQREFGSEVDASFKVCLGIGTPAEDVWLESTSGGMIICPGGTIADGPAGPDGCVTFSNTLAAGGFTDMGLGEKTVVVFRGDQLPYDFYDIQHHSPDINGDLMVNLTDVQLFTADFYGLLSPFRSDFNWDGVINLLDISTLALGFGAGCSTKSSPTVYTETLGVPLPEMGIFFDPSGQDRTLSSGPQEARIAYLVLKNPPTGKPVCGWQCAVGKTDNVTVTAWEPAGQSLNILKAPQFIVGTAGSKADPQVETTLLMTIRFHVTDNSPAHFFLNSLSGTPMDHNAPAVLVGRENPGLVMVHGPEINSGEPAAFINDDYALSEGETKPPAQVSLDLHNAPNPFNPQTAIRFNLSEDRSVEIRFFDLSGRHVSSVNMGMMPAGSRKVIWKGNNENGSVLPSGTYFYRLLLDGQPEGPVVKTTLLK